MPTVEAARPGQVITNSIGMKLVLLPAGEFMMGSGESAEVLAKAFDTKAEFFEDEHPQHRVTITRPFYLGAHEVTLGQFLRFYHDAKYKTEAERDGKGGYGYTGDKDKPFAQNPKFVAWNTGFPQKDDHPVVNVSWNDAVAFCEWLSGKEGKTYRLPTEAEWEYACRAGSTRRWWFGDDAEGLAQVANVEDASSKVEFPAWRTISGRDGYVFTAPVGSFRANAWGLYDMHGNVYEWCSDGYAEDYYSASPAVDPKGADSAGYRVLRGGGWTSDPRYTGSASRTRSTPDYRYCHYGFRLARTP
ncbi:MAG: formylglycine-generating enzyme family protein [Planctomycetes bacterium]|nr:formylglycine-generating enzyme family protein [Planctomycetota bacterium]